MAPPPPLHLTGGLVADGRRPPYRADVVVADGRIRRVVAAGELVPALPDGTRRLDVRDHLVTPGLIDAHTHLFSDGGPTAAAYERELLHDPLPLRTLRAAHHAGLALDHGFTTLRDVCTEGAGFADVALRAAIEAGLCEGPRLLPSGPGVATTGGYMPSGLAPGTGVPAGCAICDGPDAIRREVRRQIRHGSAWIKVFADWGGRDPVTGERTTVVTFDREELTALVTEAGRRGRRIAAHATSDAGARQAAECGAASIEHLGDLSRATLDLLAARGVVLVPTLSVVEQAVRSGPPGPERDAARRRLDTTAAAFGRALAAGVTIACGSDIGSYPHADGALSELRLMAEFGMTADQALRAATGTAAALLALAGDDGPAGPVGTVAEGAAADICAFPGKTVSAKKPTWVLQAGAVVRAPRLSRPRDHEGFSVL